MAESAWASIWTGAWEGDLDREDARGEGVGQTLTGAVPTPAR
jgi:hypothetical protein